MFELSDWISVNDMLPVIEEGKHAVHVLCSVHDPAYEDICPGFGSDVQHLSWDGEKFKTLALGGNGNWGWHQVVDIVTHWMYYPKAYQITDPGFEFNPEGYQGYLPLDYEPVQKAIDNAKNMNNLINEYKHVDNFLMKILGENYPIGGLTQAENMIKAIEMIQLGYGRDSE